MVLCWLLRTLVQKVTKKHTLFWILVHKIILGALLKRNKIFPEIVKNVIFGYFWPLFWPLEASGHSDLL